MDTRRRRAAWRAAHRGTKELDLLIGGYAVARLGTMSEAEIGAFEHFLAVQDTDLQSWLLAPGANAPAEHEALVDAVRVFHGLDPV